MKNIFKTINALVLAAGLCLGAAIAASDASGEREFKRQQEAKSQSALRNQIADLSEQESGSASTPSDEQLEKDILFAKELCERGFGRTICEYATEGWHLARQLPGHTGKVFLKTIELNDKEYVVAADAKAKVYVWDPTKSEPIFVDNWFEKQAAMVTEKLLEQIPAEARAKAREEMKKDWERLSLQTFDAIAIEGIIYLAFTLNTSGPESRSPILELINTHKNPWEQHAIYPFSYGTYHGNDEDGNQISWSIRHDNPITETMFTLEPGKSLPNLTTRSRKDKRTVHWNLNMTQSCDFFSESLPLNAEKRTHQCVDQLSMTSRQGRCLIIKNLRNKTKHICKGHRAPITAFCCLHTESAGKDNPGFDKVISCSADRTIRIWDKKTGICDQTLSGHTSPITALEYAYADKEGRDARMVSGSKDGTVYVWEYLTPAKLEKLLRHSTTHAAPTATDSKEADVKNNEHDEEDLGLTSLLTK